MYFFKDAWMNFVAFWMGFWGGNEQLQSFRKNRDLWHHESWNVCLLSLVLGRSWVEKAHWKIRAMYIHWSYLLIHSFVVIGFMTSRYNETNSSSTIPNFVVPGPRLRFYEDSLGKWVPYLFGDASCWHKPGESHSATLWSFLSFQLRVRETQWSMDKSYLPSSRTCDRNYVLRYDASTTYCK